MKDYEYEVRFSISCLWWWHHPVRILRTHTKNNLLITLKVQAVTSWLAITLITMVAGVAGWGGGLPDQVDRQESLRDWVPDQDGEKVEEISFALFYTHRYNPHTKLSDCYWQGKICVYICAGFFVAVSWSSFLLPRDDVSSRSGLLITTLLVLVNMFNSVLEVD